MPTLMSSTEESRAEIIRHESGGDAHISETELRGERVGSPVLAPVPPVVAEFRNHLHPEIPLAFFWVGLVEECVFHLGAVMDGFDQCYLLWSQDIKDRLHLDGLHARF